ncbi:HNH endonuclease [Vibrio furnissii]|uniref:HNH endonuclease n=1 Tax=Vibrio furnissii TaxID=29494 RepID=UPI001EEADC47|nr:HNH endonuclease [Vibrio furnissii]
MTPFVLNADDQAIVKRVLEKKVSPNEKWGDDEVAELKARMKQHYIEQQEYCCAYCKVHKPSKHGGDWDLEHIMHKNDFDKWMFHPENLCVSCKECNGHKGTSLVTKSTSYTKFPSKSSNYTIIHAHYDRYEDHITSLVPGVTYRFKGGIHGKGSKTIEVCGLLRYHEEGGRTHVDPIAQAVLLMAANVQTTESYELAIQVLRDKLNARS